jgi:hypothetical protein
MATALLSLYGCSATGVPYSTVNTATGEASNPTWNGGCSSISEVRCCWEAWSTLHIVSHSGTGAAHSCLRCWQITSIQLEWEKLSLHTGNPKYAQAVRRAMRHVRSVTPSDGLHPMFMHPGSGAVCFMLPLMSFVVPDLARTGFFAFPGQYSSSVVTLGARADSLYEVSVPTQRRLCPASYRRRCVRSSGLQYLYKQYVLVGGLTDPSLEDLSDDSSAGESDRTYFKSLLGMFDASVKVCTRRRVWA